MEQKFYELSNKKLSSLLVGEAAHRASANVVEVHGHAMLNSSLWVRVDRGHLATFIWKKGTLVGCYADSEEIARRAEHMIMF